MSLVTYQPYFQKASHRTDLAYDSTDLARLHCQDLLQEAEENRMGESNARTKLSSSTPLRDLLSSVVAGLASVFSKGRRGAGANAEISAGQGASSRCPRVLPPISKAS